MLAAIIFFIVLFFMLGLALVINLAITMIVFNGYMTAPPAFFIWIGGVTAVFTYLAFRINRAFLLHFLKDKSSQLQQIALWLTSAILIGLGMLVASVVFVG